WTRLTLAGVYVYPESVAFASDQSLQVVARHGVQDDENLLWFDCSGDCSSAANWAAVDGLWRTHGTLRAAIARTPHAGSRIVVYGAAATTATVERVFGYLACDSNCRTRRAGNEPCRCQSGRTLPTWGSASRWTPPSSPSWASSTIRCWLTRAA